LHEPAVLLYAKTLRIVKRTLALKMVADVLRSLGLSSINQMTTAHIKSVFRSISTAVNQAEKGRTQWAWQQTFPVDLLMNTCEVELEGKSEASKKTIHAASLYPPWHNIVKTGFEERRRAVILAASLSVFWL